jgi:hypothetical protein
MFQRRPQKSARLLLLSGSCMHAGQQGAVLLSGSCMQQVAAGGSAHMSGAQH